MATADLKFTALTELIICDVSAGDCYHLFAQSSARYDTVPIVMAGTAGRELKVIGSQNEDVSSYILHFAAEGDRLCRIIKPTRAAMITFIAAVNTFIHNQSNLIGTVAWTDGSATGMRMDFRWASGIIATGSSGECYIDFEVTFIRYTPV